MRRALLLVLLSLGACSRGYGRGELSPTERDSLRAVLQAYVTAQEAHYANHNSYTTNLADLRLTTDAFVDVLSADAQGHAAVVSLEEGDDAGCAVYVGNAAAPGTPGGRATSEEGRIVCDVD